MKYRLLVMNGQRIVQTEQGGQWQNDKVDKAGLVKPGIYNIHLADQADKSQTYQGTIIHADRESVYQQVGKQFVRHDRKDFGKVPELGSSSNVHYEQGKAVAEAASQRLARSLARRSTFSG